MAAMIGMVVGWMKLMNHLLIVSTRLWLRLWVLLSELHLHHRSRVVVDRPWWVVQGRLLVP